MKSSGTGLPLAALLSFRQCFRKLSRNVAALSEAGPVLAGPPTIAFGSAERTPPTDPARADLVRRVAEKVQKYGIGQVREGEPVENFLTRIGAGKQAMSGSFQTSKYQVVTCSRPYRSTRCCVYARTSSPHIA